MTDIVQLADILTYRLVQFRKRIVFDILYQRPDTIFDGTDDGDYFMFIASNGFQVMSRSRMDIQTERLWLLGCKNDSHADRSGTMVFAMQEMCDKAYPGFHIALKEWVEKVKSGDRITRLSDFRPKPPVAWKLEMAGQIVKVSCDEDEIKKAAAYLIELTDSDEKSKIKIVKLYE